MKGHYDGNNGKKLYDMSILYISANKDERFSDVQAKRRLKCHKDTHISARRCDALTPREFRNCKKQNKNYPKSQQKTKRKTEKKLKTKKQNKNKTKQ